MGTLNLRYITSKFRAEIMGCCKLWEHEHKKCAGDIGYPQPDADYFFDTLLTDARLIRAAEQGLALNSVAYRAL